MTYGPSEHEFSVALAHSKSEAEGSARTYCEEGLTQGLYLDCTVDRTADGDVVISKLWALKPFRYPNGQEDAEAAFQVPVEDLVEIGTDPVMVIPGPPKDDSGCGPWSQDDNVTYTC